QAHVARAHVRCAGGVGADVVTLNQGPGRAGADDQADRRVAGNDVPGRTGAADDRVDGAADGHAGQAAVGHGGVAGLVEADVVPLDDVAHRGRAADDHAAEAEVAGGVVAADDVPGGGRGAAEQVAGRSAERDSVAEVALGSAGGGVEADDVA